MDAYSSLVKNDLLKQHRVVCKVWQKQICLRAVVNGTNALHSVFDATLAQSILLFTDILHLRACPRVATRYFTTGSGMGICHPRHAVKVGAC